MTPETDSASTDVIRHPKRKWARVLHHQRLLPLLDDAVDALDRCLEADSESVQFRGAKYVLEHANGWLDQGSTRIPTRMMFGPSIRITGSFAAPVRSRRRTDRERNPNRGSRTIAIVLAGRVMD